MRVVFLLNSIMFRAIGETDRVGSEGVAEGCGGEYQLLLRGGIDIAEGSGG